MIWNAFLLALRAVRRNLLRSALTTLGIVIGVAAVITMVSLGRGATLRITADIASMGRNLLIVAPGATRRGPGGGGAMSAAEPFDLDDVRAIIRDVPGLAAVAPAASRSQLVVYGNTNWPTSVTGSTEAYFTARNLELAYGRLFNEGEMRAGRMVCVLGDTVRRELFGRLDPLGAHIRVGKIACRVIGVLVAKGQSTFGQDLDDFVILPLRAFQRRISGKRDVNVIFLSARRADQTEKIKAEVERLLRERRHLRPGEQLDFRVQDMKEITSVLESTTQIMTLFLSAIAAVSLLVGGIGIMNIMLVSVTERTREIGIRLAIGALEHDVLLQFLIEAVALSAFGGVIGIAAGIGLAALGASLLNIPYVLDITTVAIAFVFSAFIGVIFGFFPARRAARLDPIEALRYE
jgi:putative ABC transport system permease protein